MKKFLINALACASLLVCLSSFVASAQTTPATATTSPPSASPTSTAEADELFQKQDWAAAAKAYEAVVAREPANGRALFRLGLSLHSAQSFARAAEAFRKSYDAGFQPVGSLFRHARALARAGEKEKALVALNEAVDAGYSAYQTLNTDADLASLRDDARFKETATKAERAARPCAFQPEYRQFDFWVGEWDVTVSGQPAGTNSIQSIIDGCVIFENWAGAGGGTGKSFNFYDPAIGKWRQVWVGSNGRAVDFFGEYKDGQMRYTGESAGPNGAKIQQRMTFFNVAPGSVRQLWEQSTDGGKTWTVAFDGTYARRKTAAQQ
ncbi:MAG TPA: tetratricopeptide repeat protein [Pyrinomonadaceae bacterium]|nr:tetratricopeptide repeat protein [Pyrinomonadaceae bacterium]